MQKQPDPVEDPVVMQRALDAAIDYGESRTNHRYAPAADPPIPVPPRVWYACLLHAGRLALRRYSIDGTIGFGDAGTIRIGRYDSDIESGYASAVPMAIG